MESYTPSAVAAASPMLQAMRTGEVVVITREQLKAARAARGWGVRDLSAAIRRMYPNAPLSPTAISQFENGADSRLHTLERIRAALEAEGFQFGPPSAPSVGWTPEALKHWEPEALPDHDP